MKETKLRNRPRLVDSVAGELRDWIITGQLTAGTQLLQTELADRLEVSRTPLREAFRILERDGLVRTSNNNRTVEVVAITRESLQDMYLLRERLDGLAARQAAERGLKPQHREQMVTLLAGMEDSIRAPFAAEARIRAHAEFHELIVHASGNAAMDSFLVVIRTSCAALYLPLGDEPERIQVEREGVVRSWRDVMVEANEQHREIFGFIDARDPDGAEDAAQRHVRRTLRMLDNYESWRTMSEINPERDAATPSPTV